MARMLFDRDSTSVHLNAARRHERLARRYRRAELAAEIKPWIADLTARELAAEEKKFETQAAHDDVVAADGEQDDAVRNLFDAVKTHDRSNPATPVLPALFPGGGFSSVTDQSMAKEPDAVDALATKVETLGATHPLAPHAALLRTAAQAVRAAIALEDEAIRQQKSAEAEEEIAQGKLRRKYEANYLDARKAWGRVVADRLFPQLKAAKRSRDAEGKVVQGAFAEKTA
jgi:hypothetical protein